MSATARKIRRVVLIFDACRFITGQCLSARLPAGAPAKNLSRQEIQDVSYDTAAMLERKYRLEAIDSDAFDYSLLHTIVEVFQLVKNSTDQLMPPDAKISHDGRKWPVT